MDAEKRVVDINEEKVVCPFNGFNRCAGGSCGVSIGHEMLAPDKETVITYYSCAIAELADAGDGGLVNIVGAELSEYEEEEDE